MKKIGLTTCYVNNFGACLQAYALQTTIENAGYTCEIIKYTPSVPVKEKNFAERVFYWAKEHYRCLRYKNYSYTYKSAKFFNDFRKTYLKFGHKNFPTEDSLYDYSFDYSSFVTGSDQLWNPVIHGNKNNKVYFLDFVKGGAKKIAYAPSIGVSSFPNIEIEEEAKSLLSDFDFLSCREKTGADLITKLTGRQCLQVLDPTLLLTKEQWKALCGERVIKEKYILVYRFGVSDLEDRCISSIAQKEKIKVLTLPMSPNDFENPETLLKPCGPKEFVNLINYAELVITDSFHATAFSINLNVPFVCMLRNNVKETNNMNSRIHDILALFKLENRLLLKTEDIVSCLATPINFTKSNQILFERRRHDTGLLKDALGD